MVDASCHEISGRIGRGIAGVPPSSPAEEPPLDYVGSIGITVDGSCIGNPGPGGWAAIVHWRDLRLNYRRCDLAGSERDTTNNRMELTAAIKGLLALGSTRAKAIVTSDSQYLVLGMSSYLEGWKSKGWRKSDGKNLLNVDLWRQLDALNRLHDIEWRWVQGHIGNALSDEADKLANAAARSIVSTH